MPKYQFSKARQAEKRSLSATEVKDGCVDTVGAGSNQRRNNGLPVHAQPAGQRHVPVAGRCRSNTCVDRQNRVSLPIIVNMVLDNMNRRSTLHANAGGIAKTAALADFTPFSEIASKSGEIDVRNPTDEINLF